MDQDYQETDQELQESAALDEPVAHEVDSNYAVRDIKLAPEKKRKGLIIGAVAAAIVVVLGGLAAWFLIWYNNPTQVAFDAMNQLFQAQNVGLEGELVFNNPDPDSTLQSVNITFDSASKNLPSSSSAQVSLVFNPSVVQGDPQVSVTAQNVIMKDGIIYLQIAGLVDSINSLPLDDDARASMELFISALELIDNEWWQISLTDLADIIKLTEEQTNYATESYACALQLANADRADELSAIYKQNQFVKVKSSPSLAPDTETAPELSAGHKAYLLTLDKSQLAGFINALPDAASTQEFIACHNGVAQKYGATEIDASDIAEVDESDIDWPGTDRLQVYLEISQWGHQLRSAQIFTYDDEGTYTGGGVVKFKYDAVAVNPPESYRPISELFEELFEIFSPALVEMLQQYVYEGIPWD